MSRKEKAHNDHSVRAGTQRAMQKWIDRQLGNPDESHNSGAGEGSESDEISLKDLLNCEDTDGPFPDLLRISS